MKKITWLTFVVALTAFLSSCSNSDDPKYSKLVIFGDSVSDSGTYAVGWLAASGGGRYTVNSGDPANPAKIYVDLLAERLGLSRPCPAWTGLESRLLPGFPIPFNPVAVVDHTGPSKNCRNYAMGGAQVSLPVGPANKALPDERAGFIGQLTYPVSDQIKKHLTVAGGFDGTELVIVQGGGNGIFMQAAPLEALSKGNIPGFMQDAGFAGWSKETIDEILGAASIGNVNLASEKAVAAAVQGMAKAGSELAAMVKEQLIKKGARTVLVINIPDAASSIYGAENPATLQVVSVMVSAFNAQLSAGLTGVPEVIQFDLFKATQAWFTQPSVYSLTSVNQRACSRDQQKNFLDGRAILCSVNNTSAGDVSRYLTADDVHPTPYGHSLIANAVEDALRNANKWK